MLHANITALCLIERKLLPIEVLHCGNRNFRPFWLLWPWPWRWPDDLHMRTRPVVRGVIPHVQYELIISRLSKVIVGHTYRQTDRQIQTRPKFAGGQKSAVSWEWTPYCWAATVGHSSISTLKILILGFTCTYPTISRALLLSVVKKRDRPMFRVPMRCVVQSTIS